MDIGTLTGQLEIEDNLSSVLDSASNTVRKFADGFDSLTDVVVRGGAAIVGTFAAITAGIIALGNRGSDVNDVAATFENFSGSVEAAGQTLERMRAGTLGTVSDFDLMKSASKLLAADVKLTSSQFGTLTQAAFVLQNQGLGPTKEMLDLVSQAMLTGRTRSLEMKIGKIDLKSAEESYARSLGTSRDQLTQLGKTEAARVAILDALNKKVQAAGAQQRDFGEQMEFAITSVKNWGDRLASAVAKSPSVTNAVSAIGNALATTFGDVPQKALETIVGWVNKFADRAAALGPIVINVFSSIKDKVVLIWNELVAFNDRWQITNNLITGAKFAWGVLTKAFELVKMAVQAVIAAWNQMPEWLQKITRNALEASVAMAAYSVAIQGVAVPFRALIGQLDLGLNLIGNISGSIYNITQLTKGWGDYVTNVSTAYKNFTNALKAFTVVQTASELGTKAIAEANVFLGTTSLATSDAFTKLAKAIGLTTAVEWLSNAASKALTIVKGYLAAATLALSINYEVLKTRIMASTIVMYAFAVASRVATAGMIGLGLALKAIQAIPYVALFTGIALGIMEVVKAFQHFSEARAQGQSTWEIISAKESDTWARRWINYATQFVAGVDIFETGANRLENIQKKLRKGGASPEELAPTISPGFLAPGSSEFQAARAAREREELRRQGIGLTNDAGDLIKNDFADRVESMTKSWRQATESAKIFTAAFNSLTPAQRANYDIQKQLAPEINKMIAANQAVTPAMLAVRDAEVQKRTALLDTQRAQLALLDVTQGQITQMQQQGMSLEDIASKFHVSAEAVSAYSTALKNIDTRKTAVDTFESELVAQQQRDAKRREDIAKATTEAISKAERDLNDFISEQSMTTTEFQINQIERETTAQIVEFEKQYGANKTYSDTVKKLSQQRIAALKVDNESLKQNQLKTLKEIADKSFNTWQEMARHPEQYGRSVMQQAEFTAQVTQDAFDDATDGIERDWDAISKSSKASLQRQADASRNTWQYMVDHANQFSPQIRAQWEHIADEAQRAASGTTSAWEKAFKALDYASQIADAIPGKFGDISREVIQSAQNIGRAFAEGGMVAGIVASVSEGIKWVSRLVGALREGRKEVIKFADSFDTIKPGSGFDELHDKLLELGPAGEQMWIKLTQGVPAGNKEAAERAIGEVRAALEALDSDIQKYSLTWSDLANAQTGSTKAAKDLIDSYKRLTGAGYDQDKVLKAMSGDLNTYITNAIKAGTKIPQAMQPIIEQFIRMGGLTKDAANALLGLANDGVPSLDEIRDAADRYGLSLDQLGPKVKQLSINEQAEQIATDFKTLTAAGVPFDVLINTIPESARKAQKALDDLIAKGYDKEPAGTSHWQEYKEALDAVGEATKGMGQQIQTLVTDTLKYGLELPSSLKPIIDQMIDMGALVDENGDKLMDTSRLNWATPIEEMFETLIGKLDEFIDKLGTLNGITVEPKIRPRYEAPELPSTIRDSGDILTPEVVEPSYYATGTESASGTAIKASGSVTAIAPKSAKIINFAPRGSDVIPAMLSPGEKVVPAGETDFSQISDAARSALQAIGASFNSLPKALQGSLEIASGRVTSLFNETKLSSAQAVQSIVARFKSLDNTSPKITPEIVQPKTISVDGAITTPKVEPEIVQPKTTSIDDAILTPEIQPEIVQPKVTSIENAVSPQINPQVNEPDITSLNRLNNVIVFPRVEPQVSEPDMTSLNKLNDVVITPQVNAQVTEPDLTSLNRLEGAVVSPLVEPRLIQPDMTSLNELNNMVVMPQVNPQVNEPNLTSLNELNDTVVKPQIEPESNVVKLNDFIDRLARLNDIVVSPRVEPQIIEPKMNEPVVSAPEVIEPSYYDKGTDSARGKVIDFTPRGTDVVPAMLTPGETVGPVSKEPSKVVIELDRRWLADILVPEIPGAVKRVGIR